MEELVAGSPEFGAQNESITPSFSRPVWQDQQMVCDQCQYTGQDIDTFPCAKCHTRA